MDGREFARQLRAQPSAARALLIALSGYAQPEDMKVGFRAGFDHYLVKPVDTQHLMDLLAERAQPPQARDERLGGFTSPAMSISPKPAPRPMPSRAHQG